MADREVPGRWRAASVRIGRAFFFLALPIPRPSQALPHSPPHLHTSPAQDWARHDLEANLNYFENDVVATEAYLQAENLKAGIGEAAGLVVGGEGVVEVQAGADADLEVQVEAGAVLGEGGGSEELQFLVEHYPEWSKDDLQVRGTPHARSYCRPCVCS